MKKNIELVVPTSWADVDLKTYLALQKDLKAYEDDNEAQVAFLLHHLCDLGLDEIQALAKNSHQLLKQKLFTFLSQTEYPLTKTIMIDGVEYGFEPNLNNIAYGAYIDITKFENIEINDDWAKIMSILYRPIEKKQLDTYSIKPYDGNIDGSKWYSVPMNVHFGCLFFFINLLKELQISILNSLKEKVVETSYKSILAKSGEITQQSSYSPIMMLELLKK